MENDTDINEYDEIISKIQSDINPSDDFLEKSLINEIRQTINHLDVKCQGKTGESTVEDRCRQLSYAQILVDIYKKPISNLIEPSAKLGEAYFDIKYYEQAKEHIENALKYNDDPSNSKAETITDDYFLSLTKKLSKCNLEIGQYETSLKLAQRALIENQKLFGEDDITSADIYEIMYQCEKNLENYEKAIECLNILFSLYEKIYNPISEKCAFVCNEIGDMYKLLKKNKESIEYYLKYYNIKEEMAKNNNNFEDLFQISIKIGELYGEEKEYNKAYEILKKTDEEYNNGYNRTIKDRVVYQRLICSFSSFLEDNNYYLKELLKLEEILKDYKENKKTLARTYLQIGHIYKKRKDIIKSLEYFKKAEQIFEEHNDMKLIGDVRKIIKEVTKELERMEE
jgi:tetratricopeptide (TPR) repeat protein